MPLPSHRFRWIQTGGTDESAATHWMRLGCAVHVIAERLRHYAI